MHLIVALLSAVTAVTAVADGGWKGSPNTTYGSPDNPHHGPSEGPHRGPSGHPHPGPSGYLPRPSGYPHPGPPGGPGQECFTLTTDDVRSMGNNSLFTRWRPISHFMAPSGWMNDPSGAMYDPTRQTYHLLYQWHPNHINWGNISWGHAVSKDLITWTDVGGWRDDQALALGPAGFGSYDGLGIFTGTGQPVNVHGETDGTLLVMYTSVSQLPTGWAQKYIPFTETQSLAFSTDGGITWKQYEGNPVINTTTSLPPMNWNLTGFRDPHFQPIPALDKLLGVSEPHYYAVFGSGIKGAGPRLPMWTAPSNDLTKWTFLGALWEPAANTSLGPVLSTGSYGFNFEVSNFFTLADSQGELHYYATFGTEGANMTFHPYGHWSLWNEGKLSRRANGSLAFEPIAGGQSDSGISYALTSFLDTKNHRRVQWAWVSEDIVADSGLFSTTQQGYQGAFALPRELFVHEMDNVVDEDGSLAESKTVVLQDNGHVHTLGVKPLSDVVAAIVAKARHVFFGKQHYTSTKILQKAGDAHMRIKATFGASKGAFGLVVAASPDMKEYTTISYEPSNNTVLINRSHSSTIDGFNNGTLVSYFHPYILRKGGQTRREEIVMDVFVDGSLVEVYINDRFASMGRVYPSQLCSTGFGIYVDSGAEVDVVRSEAWLGTLNVWPERPANSSSRLLYDTPEETHNGDWWQGN
ncbi:glycoside hydrolase family 32 protein [Piedraia hortae CBS 480.64]|uniref:Glycoside hydrolase family 32 protein n=1 Tax=Piedraia hortae CBS 480.64 TaxID=1314780 RepID=A0A6A7BNU5_9PEZI|nr:glycoside hydrolase family 32 protein [Piedraia hortae CBS 480.64]